MRHITTLGFRSARRLARLLGTRPRRMAASVGLAVACTAGALAGAGSQPGSATLTETVIVTSNIVHVLTVCGFGFGCLAK